MWQYNKAPSSDELYHYGVLGMKWGKRKNRTGETSTAKNNKKQIPFRKKIGKTIGNYINKKNEKNKKRDERIKKTTDWFGVGGVAIGSTISAGRSFVFKKTMANIINNAANAYISSGRGSYAVKRGVDFVRKASINALSVSALVDMARASSDIQKSINYAKSKRK